MLTIFGIREINFKNKKIMKNKNLEFTGVNSHQGDVMLFGIKGLPDGVKKIENRFIAASERSGHKHVLFGDYEMYEKDGVDGVFVVVGTDGCTLNHSKIQELTPERMRKNEAITVADHKPNFYKAGEVLFIGIQKRKKHFSKVWEKVQD
jgi:hypothetical protein